jgi:large subunit ribosomal protein L9
MRVILLEDIERVGKQGEVLNVRDGYARNYLLPRRRAITATEEQIKRVEEAIKRLGDRKAQAAKRLADKAALLEQLSLKAELRVGAEGKAFGAITNIEVAELLARANFTVDKHDVLLDEPIKEPGVHDVAVRIGPETKAIVKLWVVAQTVENSTPPKAES